MSNEWLQTLKPGDKVIVDRHLATSVVATVDRVTATQIIVGEMRFRRSTGVMATRDRWHVTTLREATPPRIAVVRREWLIRKLSSLSQGQLNDLTTEVLESVYAIIVRKEPADAPP